MGATVVAAYAAREGVAVSAMAEHLGPALTPEQVGKEIVELAAGSGHDKDAYLLGAAGLSPAP